MTSPIDFPGLRVLPPGQHRSRRVVIVTIIVVVLALIALPSLATFVTDLYWFREIGFTPVFVTSLVWQVALFAVGAAVAFAVFWGNLHAATGGANRSPIVITNANTGVRIDVSRFVPASRADRVGRRGIERRIHDVGAVDDVPPGGARRQRRHS